MCVLYNHELATQLNHVKKVSGIEFQEGTTETQWIFKNCFCFSSVVKIFTFKGLLLGISEAHTNVGTVTTARVFLLPLFMSVSLRI